LALTGLQHPVKVVRDEKGMPYIFAANWPDAFQAMGFVTAQDRLFQMELTRMVATGRIAELVGEKGLALDRRMRTIGIHRLAERHARLLQEDATALFRCYLAGVNAFVERHAADHQLEFRLAGIQPTPWTVPDVLAVMYYMSWSTSANIKTEIISQMLVERLGPARAEELLPLNLNPDDDRAVQSLAGLQPQGIDLLGDRGLAGFMEDDPLGVGSNNWVCGPAKSPGRKPILANDPHLDARILPGPWYPCGLVTPGLTIVGAHIPGLPVMPIFRNDHVTAGITNAYGDVQDLYVEALDPFDAGRYLEGDRSIPFQVIEETLRIKDTSAPEGYRQEKMIIRLTRRGPVISDAFPNLDTDRVLTLRWAAAESMRPDSDFTRIMRATSAEDLREALKDWTTIQLNFVFADREGNIGWQVSGTLPNRIGGGGTVPYVVKDGSDNWSGWIPFEDMPQSANPEEGWLGTCNHMTVRSDYPYYYSSYFASSYRYRRLKTLMTGRSEITAEEHYRFQRDTRNVMAEALVPIMVPVLTAHEDTRAMGDLLSGWDCEDAADQTAPTVFHAISDRWAFDVFVDELGEQLTRTMLATWYFWQERFQSMVNAGQSPWFDDINTTGVRETSQDILYRAAQEAQQDLASRLGNDMDRWRWGRVHTITFVSPIRREGFGKGLLGGGEHPVSGSGETLRRGRYDFNQPFAVNFSASLRMVADLSDSEKVLAVIPGGISGRVFHPHARDQMTPFLEGGHTYWWFSRGAIDAHAQSELVLQP
jgi:penicillin amidase